MPLHWTEWTSALNVSNWIIYIFTQFSLTRKLSSLEYDLPSFFFNPKTFFALSKRTLFFFSRLKFGGKWQMTLMMKKKKAHTAWGSFNLFLQKAAAKKAENSTNEILIEIYLKCEAIKVALYVNLCRIIPYRQFHNILIPRPRSYSFPLFISLTHISLLIK